jgi:hypothetical protein
MTLREAVMRLIEMAHTHLDNSDIEWRGGVGNKGIVAEVVDKSAPVSTGGKIRWAKVKSGGRLEYVCDIYATEKYARESTEEGSENRGLIVEDVDVFLPEHLYTHAENLLPDTIFPVILQSTPAPEPEEGEGEGGGEGGEEEEDDEYGPRWTAIDPPYPRATKNGQLWYTTLNEDGETIWELLDPGTGAAATSGTPLLSNAGGKPTWRSMPDIPDLDEDEWTERLLPKCGTGQAILRWEHIAGGGETEEVWGWVCYYAGIPGQVLGTTNPGGEIAWVDAPSGIPPCPPSDDNKKYVLTCQRDRDPSVQWEEVAEFECPEEEEEV